MKNLKQIFVIFSMVAIYLTSLPAFAQTQTAVFAGGCFWSMQHDFDKVKGVVKTTVGYTGGHIPHPTYEQVSTGTTGHYEAIQVEFDPSQISYQQVVEFYLHDIDPTDAEGQFCDNGEEYKPAIFYMDKSQQQMATTMKDQLIASKRFDNVAVSIKPVQPFYPAEEYHQKYAEKNPINYSAYRLGCQRDQRLQAVWRK